MESRKGYYPIEGYDYARNDKKTFFISAKLVEQIEKETGRRVQYYDLLSACEVLAEPLFIFRGLSRKGYENALCYIGIPKRHSEGWEGPPPPGMVFLVCISASDVVFEWGWEKASAEDRERPENDGVRFKETIWKHS